MKYLLPLIGAFILIAGQSYATGVTGAGIGAKTGNSRSTNTYNGMPNADTDDKKDYMSGTANIGTASSSGVAISSTSPNRNGMVAAKPLPAPKPKAADSDK